MTFNMHKSIIIVISIVLLSGCETHRLSALNAEFEDVYQDKIGKRAVLLSGLPVLPSESVQGQLTQIATTATEAADDLSLAEKARLRIGFRRLAVMASWQAAVAKEDPTLSLQSKGQEDCNTAGNHTRSPRDCLMIDYVGTLAANDASARRMLIESKLPDGETKYPEDRLAIFKDLFTKFKGYLGDIKTTTTNSKDKPVAQAFWTAVGKQTLIVYCNARTAAVYYSETKGTPTEQDEDYWVKLVNSMNDLKGELTAIFPGINYTRIGCQSLNGRAATSQSPV